jgi:mRNA-degrading endonuclease toxin of MazEF toxin-antitoxin module
LRRGEIWTVAGGADYAGKPRPAVIGTRIGTLDAEDVVRLNRAILVFLGLAGSPRA